MACSDLGNRQKWFPPLALFNRAAIKPVSDQPFYYDIGNKKVTPLKVNGFDDILTLHGLDFYEPQDEPGMLYLYYVNHRPSKTEFYAKGKPKADSVIEVFKHKIGSFEMNYVETIASPLIRTPNNVVAVGKRSVYVTNDHKTREHSIMRQLEDTLATQSSDVVFWHEGEASKVLDGYSCPNGIAKGGSHHDFNLIYVSHVVEGIVRVFERQPDGPDVGALELVDEIDVGFVSDNISLDPDTGDIYCAGHPAALQFLDAVKNVSAQPYAPSMVKRASVNTASTSGTAPDEPIDGAFLGKKYTVETVYSDPDGRQVSASTIAALDPNRKALLISGLWSQNIVHCKV